jgi:methionine-rich copper-binding protein CopC
MLLAGCLLAGAASSANAHAELVQSTPAADSVVQEVTEVRLEFSEAIEIELSRIAILDETGEELDHLPAPESENERVITLTLPEGLEAGSYRIIWEVVSSDMHKVEGEFGFRIGP